MTSLPLVSGVVPNHRAWRAFRLDVLAVMLAVSAAIAFVVLLDTGWLATWMATNRDAKIDEISVVSVALVSGVGLFAVRRWLGLSYRLVQFEASTQAVSLTKTLDVQLTVRRDLIGVSMAVVAAFVAVAWLDTGSLAVWIAQQSHRRIDEAIVSTFVLMAGLTFVSIRRWLELSQQLAVSDALYRATTELNREATILGELSELLQSCRSSEEAYRITVDHAQVLFPGSAGAVCMIAASRDLVGVMARWGEPALADHDFAPADCWALRLGRPHVLGDEVTGVRCPHIGPILPTRAMCVPMMAQSEALGLLYLEAGRPNPVASTSAAWSDAERRLVKTLSEQTALALANLALRETLRLQSVRDPLTGLYNRGYLEESLERELRRSARRGTPLGVMMIDVDHFKRLNDTFGHEAGDAALRALGDLFLAHVRGEDVVCRYGGEEFTMLLPEASRETTCARAESLREAATRLVVQSHGRTLERVTISIGVAGCPDDGATSEVVLRAADSALYRAKEAGRNRVLRA